MNTFTFNYLSKKWMFIFIFFLYIIQIKAQEYTTILNIPYYNDSIRRSDNYIAERCMLYEIGGYGHNITDAAIPIVIREVRKVIKESQQN